MPLIGRAGHTGKLVRAKTFRRHRDSPGKIGTAIGQQHLRSILAFCNSPQMNSIEAYIQFEQGLITDDGQVTNEVTEDFLRTYMQEFAAFIERVYTVLPRNP